MVSNEQIIAIEGYAGGAIQTRASRQFAVAAESGGAVPGNCRDHPRRTDLPDALIAGIGNEQVTAGVKRQSHWAAQAGTGGEVAIATKADPSVAGNRRDDPVMDQADALIAQIGDVQVTSFANHDRERKLQTGANGGSVVATEADRAVPGYGGDCALGNSADSIVEGIGNKQVAFAIRGDSAGAVETTTCARTVVATKIRRPIARRRADDAVRVYPPDAIVECVSDPEIPVAIDRRCFGAVQTSARGGALVATKASGGAARYSRDAPSGLQVADPIVERIGDEQIIIFVQHDSNWKVQTRTGRRAAITTKTSCAGTDYGRDRRSLRCAQRIENPFGNTKNDNWNYDEKQKRGERGPGLVFHGHSYSAGREVTPFQSTWLRYTVRIPETS